MKKKFKVIIFLLSLGGIYFGLHLADFNQIPEEPIQPKPQYEYFIPVSKFTNTKLDYSVQNLKESELITTYQNFDLLKDLYPVSTVLEENILDRLENGAIALLTPEEVSPKYKTLFIEGQNFWDKGLVLKDYPIRIEATQSTFEEKPKYNIFAGGEIIPARAVDRLGLNLHNNYTYLFDFFKEELLDADISIALLENSIMGDPTPCTGCMSFQGDNQVAQGLADIGFDFLSLAGNHAGDAGQDAMQNTIEQLNSLKIQTTGSTSGKYSKSLKPITKEINGQTIGMISADDIAFYYWYGGDDEKYYTTNFSKRDNNGALVINQDQINKIQTIKSENDIDYLIVYMSWGVEYTNYPTNHQKDLAHAIIDAGADLIMASHPHWVQSVEFYNDTPIIYSMGNFLFDQTHTIPTRQAINVNFHYWNNQLKSIEIMPHQTCGYHQTKNDLADEYLNGEISLEDIYSTDESQGCVYWQPKKLKEDHPSYTEILERVFEYTVVMNK